MAGTLTSEIHPLASNKAKIVVISSVLGLTFRFHFDLKKKNYP